MRNSKYFEDFNQVCLEVEQIFCNWHHPERSHYQLLNLVLSKIKDDFFQDKVAPALIGPTLAYRTIKGKLNSSIYILAAAHFLFYAFLDITDDVEDQDLNDPLLLQAGDALSTNAGTSLLFLSLLALDELQQAGISTQLIHLLRQKFIEAGWFLTVGQHRDLHSRQSPPISPENALETMRLKTGTSVKLYFESAALLATPNQSGLVHQFGQLGETLGVLVQIMGDYLDIFAKNSSDDLRNQCQTLPLILCRERLKNEDVLTLETCLKQVKENVHSHHIIRHLIQKSGALEPLNQLIVNYRNHCFNLAAQIENEHKIAMQPIQAFIARIKPISPEGGVSV